MTESKIRDCVAVRLVQFRNDQHISQTEMAEKLFTTRSNYAKYEARLRTPGILMMLLMCDVMNLQSIHELINCSNLEQSRVA